MAAGAVHPRIHEGIVAVLVGAAGEVADAEAEPEAAEVEVALALLLAAAISGDVKPLRAA